MGDIFGALTGGGGGRRARNVALNFPPELQQLMDQLLGLTGARISGGDVTPFVQFPEAPQLGISDIERGGMDLTRGLQSELGIQPLTEAFEAARGLAGRPLGLAEIGAEVEPTLQPFFENLIERERRGRLQVGEELTGQGVALGSPLLQQQRLLSEQTNRDIAQAMSQAILGERAQRGRETMFGTEALRRVGGAPLAAARQFGGLPRRAQAQQFGLEQAAAGGRQAAIQQVLNLLMGGAGLGTQQFGIRTRGVLGAEELGFRERESLLNFLFKLFE
ncbi:MAG: hypothetical protein ACE5JM_15105 [Armatimonadota bacterium]